MFKASEDHVIKSGMRNRAVIPFDVSNKLPQEQLSFASMFGDLKHIKYALRSGADLNTKHEGSTPLHDACNQNQYYAAKLLIRLGADLDAKDDQGRTPLICACDCMDLTAIPEPS